jgi:hypothetical protein
LHALSASYILVIFYHRHLLNGYAFLRLQVDLIICWDASSPSRMRQREGRTGRSRPGRVVYLLSEGREAQHYEDNHAKEQLVKVRWTAAAAATVQAHFVPASLTRVGSKCPCYPPISNQNASVSAAAVVQPHLRASNFDPL